MGNGSLMCWALSLGGKWSPSFDDGNWALDGEATSFIMWLGLWMGNESPSSSIGLHHHETWALDGEWVPFLDDGALALDGEWISFIMGFGPWMRNWTLL